MPTEIPILFSTPMVEAILEGRKTMTRRLIKFADGSNPSDDDISWFYHDAFGGDDHGRTFDKIMDMTKTYPYWKECKCPYGKPGDILWVRETWTTLVHNNCQQSKEEENYIVYKASAVAKEWESQIEGWRWRPSIFMPRTACRIWNIVQHVGVERLHDISQEDAEKEGLLFDYSEGKQFMNYHTGEYCFGDSRDSFQTLWQKINGVESWRENPWVWVISFKVLSTTGKPIEFPSLNGASQRS